MILKSQGWKWHKRHLQEVSWILILCMIKEEEENSKIVLSLLLSKEFNFRKNRALLSLTRGKMRKIVGSICLGR